MGVELIGQAVEWEGVDRFLFSMGIESATYDKYSDCPNVKGFIYVRRRDGEGRSPLVGIASILAHCPEWSPPTTVFSPEEIERIVNLQPSKNPWG